MSRQTEELSLFLRRWFAHPLRVGAVLPSSPALSKLVAKNAVDGPDSLVLELGAGTGTVSRALLEAGLDERRLIMVELDSDYVAFLRKHFPQATVIEGDASRPRALLPDWALGQVTTVISGIPALQFPLDKQRNYMDECFSVLREGGQVLQYTYSLKSPLPYEKLAMDGRRLGLTLANLPPAHLWCYNRPTPGFAKAAE
jgi:phosphatidylethanolamine/phosphatidyl-N-methylethanolamine N-methyltransferase